MFIESPMHVSLNERRPDLLNADEVRFKDQVVRDIFKKGNVKKLIPLPACNTSVQTILDELLKDWMRDRGCFQRSQRLNWAAARHSELHSEALMRPARGRAGKSSSRSTPLRSSY